MEKKSLLYNDFALILSWPDTTIRGDEKWMMFFKKIGLVKNLNFKVGHTGIIIGSSLTGELLYYDFGRYISPRGYGRARSQESDPLLAIDVKAEIQNKQITNLEEIASYLEERKSAMSVYGELYFSLVENIDFRKAKEFADHWVSKGSYPYGAVAKGNNNCSRFITRLLFKSSKTFNWRHPINFPETIKASPISNIVNSAKNNMIYSFSPQNGLKHFKMSRKQSLLFLVKKIGENINPKKAALLPEDITIGGMIQKSKPQSIPQSAQYLGGVGEGAWFDLSILKNDNILIQRFTEKGVFEYAAIGAPETKIDNLDKIQITYDSHLLITHIVQDFQKIKITHIQQITNQEIVETISTEMIA